MSDWPAAHNPHSFIGTHNPVFDAEYRRMRWPRSMTEIDQYNRYLLIGSSALIVIAAIGGWLLLRQRIILELEFFLLLANLGMTIAADIYYMLITINSINHQIVSGQWDELRLTSLRTEYIVQSKYAAMQIRVWWMLALQRMIGLLPFTAAVLISLVNVIFEQSANWLLGAFLIFFIGGTILIWPLTFLYFESLLHMQTVTAISFFISARIHNQTFAILMGFAAILAVRLLQLGALLPLVGVLLLTWPLNDVRWIILLGFMGLCFTIYLVWTLHRRLQNAALKYTLKAAFASD